MAASTDPELLIERRDGYAIVTLNRPAAMNALSRPLVRALVAVTDELEADRAVRAMIITGAGRAFCVGMDLKELQGANSPLADEGGLWSSASVNPITHLQTFSGPIVAAVNGAAITGGFELALACDMIFASTSARFADTHARVGIFPGGGISQLLARAIGPYRARELSLTGNFLSAAQAEAWGLVNRVVAPDELLATAEDVVRAMLELDDDMLKGYKKLINDGYAATLAQGLQIEEALARSRAQRSRPQDIQARREGVVDRGRDQSRR